MIFQKSFSDLLLKKHFLKSMLKTIVKINIFVETMIQCFVLFSQKVQKNNLFEIFCNKCLYCHIWSI